MRFVHIAQSAGRGEAHHEATTRSANAWSYAAAPEPSEVLSLGDSAIWSDATVRRLYKDQEHGRLAELYVSLCRQLKLTDAEMGKLLELISERNECRVDVSTFLWSPQAGQTSALVQQRWTDISEKFKQRFVSLFGSSAYLLFEEHERRIPVWQLVNNFAGAVAMEGEPLSPAQAEELVTVLADASTSYQQGGTADPNEIEWPETAKETEDILTPPQQRTFLNLAPIYPIVLPIE